MLFDSRENATVSVDLNFRFRMLLKGAVKKSFLISDCWTLQKEAKIEFWVTSFHPFNRTYNKILN